MAATSYGAYVSTSMRSDGRVYSLRNKHTGCAWIDYLGINLGWRIAKYLQLRIGVGGTWLGCNLG
jgi:hypothetical protein